MVYGSLVQSLQSISVLTVWFYLFCLSCYHSLTHLVCLSCYHSRSISSVYLAIQSWAFSFRSISLFYTWALSLRSIHLAHSLCLYLFCLSRYSPYDSISPEYFAIHSLALSLLSFLLFTLWLYLFGLSHYSLFGSISSVCLATHSLVLSLLSISLFNLWFYLFGLSC